MNEQTERDGSKSYKSKPVKKCPRCQMGQLVIRTNQTTFQEFLGCTEYPFCQHSEPLPPDILLRAQGAPTLPGMD